MRLAVAAFGSLFSLTFVGPAAAQSVTAALDYGTHPVGFRVVTGMPIGVAMWYPATEGTGASMTAEHYKTVRGPLARTAMEADLIRIAGTAGLSATSEQVTEALTRPTKARRDAPHGEGRFPVIVAGASPGVTWIQHEYLASHGYVVMATWSSVTTGTLQATQPNVALDTRTHELTSVVEFARRQPFVDDTKLGLLGVNFDGMTVLNYAMHRLHTKAIVSLDGYEGKVSGTGILRQSPHFDPARVRVPYLIVVQDERDPGPPLVHDRTLWESLTYAERYWYVLAAFNHAHLISDAANIPTLSSAQRAGHVFIRQTLRRFFDAYVKDDADAKAALEHSLTERLHNVEARISVLRSVRDE